MKPTKLQWEDVIQFEEVKGYGQHIWKDEDKYYLVLEGGNCSFLVSCLWITKWVVFLIRKWGRTLHEVSWKVQNDRWPPTEKEKKASEKRFIEQSPTSLIDLPETRELFTQEELERLIPLAEQMWIDWRGKLPDDYVSPLK